MTKEKLSRLHKLRREITRTKKRIAEIRNNGARMKQSKEALGRLEGLLENYLSQILSEAAELVEYINNIEDLTVREIFMLRYFDDVRSWQKIAFEIGEYDESFVRRKHNAYLEKEKKPQ